MQARRGFVFSLLLLMPLSVATAQSRSWWGVSFQPAIPLSNTKEFTDNFAWRGVGVDFKKQIKPNVAVGLSFGWQVFDEQTDDVVSAFGLDISGDQFRYVNSWPILANVSYFFGKEGHARPYVAGNVGTYIMEHQLEIGLYAIHETNWHFGFAPEAGVAFPLHSNVTAFVNSRYNYTLAAGSVDDQSYLSFSLGVAWAQGF
jgi:opacity protein-like surface antigen